MGRAAWTRAERDPETGYVTWVADDDKARAKFADAQVDDRGVVTWKSNGSVPPADCREQWARIGMPFDAEASEAERDRQVDETVRRYREARANRTPEQRAEEAFEMRAAFGPGETVVDVFTGERFRT